MGSVNVVNFDYYMYRCRDVLPCLLVLCMPGAVSPPVQSPGANCPDMLLLLDGAWHRVGYLKQRTLYRSVRKSLKHCD